MIKVFVIFFFCIHTLFACEDFLAFLEANDYDEYLVQLKELKPEEYAKKMAGEIVPAAVAKKSHVSDPNKYYQGSEFFEGKHLNYEDIEAYEQTYGISSSVTTTAYDKGRRDFADPVVIESLIKKREEFSKIVDEALEELSTASGEKFKEIFDRVGRTSTENQFYAYMPTLHALQK